MSVRFFLDTNVLVYSFDAREPRKAKLARELIEKAMSQGSGIISTQVVQEFLNLALTKWNSRTKVQRSSRRSSP